MKKNIYFNQSFLDSRSIETDVAHKIKPDMLKVKKVNISINESINPFIEINPIVSIKIAFYNNNFNRMITLLKMK